MNKLILLFALIVFSGCISSKHQPKIEKPEEGSELVLNVELQDNFKKAKLKKDELTKGCQRKDCIPSIDHPEFETIDQANTWLTAEDLVFIIQEGETVKAYPEKILNWHEIVNDEKFILTFPPFSGSALAFESSVDGIFTEFGVSGFLYNNNLIMYDRYEGNLWQQISGEAIVGPAAERNEFLKQIPVKTTTWEKLKNENPEAQILSKNTGIKRNYDIHPYGTYKTDQNIPYKLTNTDTRLPLKKVVYGIKSSEKTIVYPEEHLDKIPENSNPVRSYWFIWASFYPETEIYQP